jgi:hypothetical protein
MRHTMAGVKQNLALERKLFLVIVGSTLAGLVALASPESQALTCDGFSVEDDLVLIVINDELVGYEHEINKRKTLVINYFESVTSDGCEVVIEANVTLKRKIRKDAHGTMILEGTLDTSDGLICLLDTHVTDFRLSHTLEVGEWFYEKLAGEFDVCL